METKICTKCGEEKELDLFFNNKSKKDGKQSQCKECVREANRKYRLENPEKATESVRKWQLENPEKVRGYARKCKLENPEKAREYVRKSRRELKPGYVKALLRAQFNIPASETTPLDIKEKREQLQFHRQIQLLTNQLKQNENKS